MLLQSNIPKPEIISFCNCVGREKHYVEFSRVIPFPLSPPRYFRDLSSFPELEDTKFWMALNQLHGRTPSAQLDFS